MLNIFRNLLDKVREELRLPEGTITHSTILTEQQLMSVALMQMVASADFNASEQEAAVTRHYLQTELGLNAQDAETVYQQAQKLADNSVSLHEFTSKLKQLSYENRLDLLTSLWQVAYADKSVDPNEEAMLRKIADLLFIRHADYIQCKLAVTAN